MGEKQWFWATLTLSSITIVSVVFAAWELVENRFFRDANYLTLHYLYITRGRRVVAGAGVLGRMVCASAEANQRRRSAPLERTLSRTA